MIKWAISRKHGASDLVLTMLIWGVASVLGTRMYLEIFNNPSWQFGVWHIAHVLWGGLLMLGSLLILLTANGKRAQYWGAAVGGVGWGLFIDEVGKYLTKDNDYWFQPAIIFIYISFIALFIVYRILDKSNPEDTRTVLYSILDQIGEVLENDLEEKERKAILRNIDIVIEKESNINIKKLAWALKKAVGELPTVEDRDALGLKSIITRTMQMSYRLFRKKLVTWIVAAYSVYFAADKLIDTIRIAGSSQRMDLIEYFYQRYDFFGRADIYMISLKMAFDLVSAVLIVIGWYFLAKKKTIKSLAYFQNGLLVSILFSSVFKFYFEQFSAVFSLTTNILIYYSITGLKQELKSSGQVKALNKSDIYSTTNIQ